MERTSANLTNASSASMKSANKILIITGLIIGVIFSELDETVVTTALPTIIRDLGGMSLYGWVAGVYMLAMTSFIPILGKLADLYGRKRIYLLSMGLFITGSIVSGMASSMTVLLIGRGIQGMGAGGLMPLAMVIFGESFSVEERAKFQGIFGAIMFIPQLLGPLIGGYFTQHISWHWIFWVNLPVGVIAALVLSAGLPESKGDKKASIDWAGAFLLVTSLLSLLLTPVLHENQGYSWHSPILISLLVLGTVLLGLFVFAESKAKEPILPLFLFKNRTFVVLSLLIFMFILAVMGSFSSLPFFAQNLIGLTPIEAGYLSLPIMIGGVLSSVVLGPLMMKVKYRTIYVFALILTIIAFYLMTGIDMHTKIITLIMYFVILGLGFGVLFNNNLIIQESVPKEYSGVALSSVTLFQSIGMTIGFSIFGSLLATNITSGMKGIAGNLPPDIAGKLGEIENGRFPKGISSELLDQLKGVFVNAFHHLYWISFILAIVVFFIAWFLKGEVLTKRSDEKEKAAAEA